MRGVGEEEHDEDLEIGDIVHTYVTRRKLKPSGKMVMLIPTGKQSLNLQSLRFILIGIFSVLSTCVTHTYEVCSALSVSSMTYTSWWVCKISEVP